MTDAEAHIWQLLAVNPFDSPFWGDAMDDLVMDVLLDSRQRAWEEVIKALPSMPEDGKRDLVRAIQGYAKALAAYQSYKGETPCHEQD